MKIREAGRVDSLAIEQISEDSGYPVPELALDEERIKKMFDKGDIILIADLKGEPMGYAAFRVTIGDKIEIDSLEVRRGHHNQGIGTELMKHIEEKASETDTKELFLYCHPRNKYAIEFYHSKGFERKGLVPDHYSTGEPAILFSKRIK